MLILSIPLHNDKLLCYKTQSLFSAHSGGQEHKVEVLLRFYSPVNPFGMTEKNEAELLGLDPKANLQDLRATVSRFRLATRQKWQLVQRLRRVSESFEDLSVTEFQSFEKNMAKAFSIAETE